MIASHTPYSAETFRDLDLQNIAIEGSEFYDCSFEACKLVGASLQRCRLVDCRFSHCDLSLLQVPDSSFSALQFADCKIVGVDWTRARWGSAALSEPFSFLRSALNHSTFIGLALPRLQVIECSCREVDFREADLREADFAGTDLEASLFQHTGLTHADFSRARNYHINPAENSLRGAKFALPEAMALLYGLEIELVDLDAGQDRA